MAAITTYIPGRMDRLPWSRFHWLVLFALGITWILDGLEVTLTGAISGVLSDSRSLGLTPAEIGVLGSAYVAGAVVGALYFGHLADRLGRKKLFFITLAVYLVGVLLSAFSTGVWTFALFRFITGAGIGGEYAAINSAVDELIPARVRGKVDLLINGTYWLGAALGSVSTLWLLNPAHFDVDLGWRIGFGAGAVIGLGILFLRGMVPESPRWLMLRGREKEAEEIVDKIEKDIESKTGVRLETVTRGLSFHLRPHLTFREVAKVIFGQYRTSSYLGVCLMSAQAFLFNAVFFTYALVLTQFYGIEGKDTGIYLLPFALGNFAGPVCLGHFFDTIGRKPMIVITYTVSGVLLAITGYLFAQGYLSAFSQTLLWTVIFFFASAAASAAYLTVSEIFPLEVRAMAIALFFSLGTGLGGIVAPWLFGTLIGTGSAYAIFGGYLVASILMVGAAMAEWKWGIACERKCLEDIAAPVSSAPMPGIA